MSRDTTWTASTVESRSGPDDDWNDAEGSAEVDFPFSDDSSPDSDSDSAEVDFLFSDDSSPDSDLDATSLSEGDGQFSEGDDYLLERITFHQTQGRARSRRKPWSQSLVERELNFWR
jgi:hypothetical protein